MGLNELAKVSSSMNSRAALMAPLAENTARPYLPVPESVLTGSLATKLPLASTLTTFGFVPVGSTNDCDATGSAHICDPSTMRFVDAGAVRRDSCGENLIQQHWALLGDRLLCGHTHGHRP
jgi:hypothetical protein